MLGLEDTPRYFCSGDGLRRVVAAGMYGACEVDGPEPGQCAATKAEDEMRSREVGCPRHHFCPGGHGANGGTCEDGHPPPCCCPPGKFTPAAQGPAKDPGPEPPPGGGIPAAACDVEPCCAFCPPGQYAPVTVGGSCLGALDEPCSRCEAGRYDDGAYGRGGGGGNSECEACPAGKVQDQQGKKACVHCTRGQFQDQVGQSASKECREPQFFCTSPPGLQAPLLCASGWYTTTDDAGRRVDQRQCEAGEFCLDGEKTDCPTGRFQDQGGQTDCKPCARGKFAKEPGSVECTACYPGTFSDTIARSVCELCAAGTCGARRARLAARAWNG